ncbi:hypothetical protein Ddc_16536 [Ditylenchus destructor]|nr:hypothetical protein Ddc_16536 [Ditylenchus destructor]
MTWPNDNSTIWEKLQEQAGVEFGVRVLDMDNETANYCTMVDGKITAVGSRIPKEKLNTVKDGSEIRFKFCKADY